MRLRRLVIWLLGQRQLAHDAASETAGADVEELQCLLGGLGYDLPTDNIYGRTTANQVRQFQDDRGLLIDGVFGPVTCLELLRLRELVARRAKPQYRRDHQQ